MKILILHPERLVVEFMILFAMTKDFFHDPVLVSAVDSEKNAMLVGNLIVMGNSDGDEILHGLSDEELKHLKKNLAVIGVERDKKITSVYMVLCNVEYL